MTPQQSLSLSTALLFLCFTAAQSASSSSSSSTLATLSITSYLPYAAQRECVKDCLYDGSNWVGSFIGCGSPYYNLCYCNANFGSSAISYVSACVSSVCSGGLDAPTAVSIYTAYCAGAGLPLGVVAAQTTQAGSGSASAGEVTQTVTGVSTMQLGGGSMTTVPVTITNVVTTYPSPAHTQAGQTSPSQAAATAAPSAISSNSPPLGAILGGALGGAAILGIAAVLIVYFVLRHKRWVRSQQQQIHIQEPKPSPGGGPPIYTSPVESGHTGFEGSWQSREMDGRSAAMLGTYAPAAVPGPKPTSGYNARELPG